MMRGTVTAGLVAVACVAGCARQGGIEGVDAWYDSPVETARHERMQWFREARFGLFVHYGMFSTKRHPEMRALNQRRSEMSSEAYIGRRAALLQPAPEFAETLVATAKAAGMKYIVFTAKHHGGFPLWDCKLTDYNSVKLGPKRDLVAEYVKACRAAGLKVGIYFSLADGHNPDGRKCATDDAARRRFLDYTRGQLRELMSNYGRIDVLWYDGPNPLGMGYEWEGRQLNAMVRHLQPRIVINDRTLWAEDFTCIEGHMGMTSYPNQDYEVCMEFNDTWAYDPKPDEAYQTPRQIVELLCQVTRGGGNLLLNVGPNPDGANMMPIEEKNLRIVGQWLKQHGEATYGPVTRVEKLEWIENNANGRWTRKGNTGYLWLPDWPEGEIVLTNAHTALLGVSIVGGGDVPFTQADEVVTVTGLPGTCPDPVLGYAVLKFRFDAYPRGIDPRFRLGAKKK